MCATRHIAIPLLLTAWGLISGLGLTGGWPASAQTRDLVLTDWAAGQVALRPGMTLENRVRSSPTGEPLSRVTFTGAGGGYDLLTRVNLPPTAQDVSIYLHTDDFSPRNHEAIFTDVHGWTGVARGFAGFRGNAEDTSPVTNLRWTWRIGFANAKPTAPFAFRGLRLTGRDFADTHGDPVTLELGPAHVSYTPDDRQWLYADTQPKVLSSRDGVLPPLTLRIANLGTTERAFRLSARLMERNHLALNLPPLSLGTLTLAAGELREIPLALPLSLLGRYNIEYRATPQREDAQTARDTIAVVNARDLADGFRHWAAARSWFSVPNRRPLTDPRTGKAKIMVTTASNGLSPVPIFPVQSRVPPRIIPWSAARAKLPQAPGTLAVLQTQLSPAWLMQSSDTALTLFGGTPKAGLGGPSHVAFATPTGTRVLSVGASLDAAALKAMSQPWLLAWWQGSDGWRQWDVPYLVILQHRPTTLRLDARGVSVSFAGPVESLTSLPLLGYAKLPQQKAFAADPTQFHLPADWPRAQLNPWTWGAGLPPAVVARCNWWTRALREFPYNLRETDTINHHTGSVDVHDAFDYIDIPNDWHTPADLIAPLSPSLALARQGGYPMTVHAKLTDCQYATLLGPYLAAEGTKTLDYSLDIGPYWMQAADPNVTAPPANPANPANLADSAQAALLAAATASTGDDEGQMWDYQDGNFVWDMQSGDLRDPAYQTGYTVGSGRRDRKGWLQARALDTLLNRARYGLDERAGTMTRRYIDGPGIGDFGASDYGDAGKLGADMIFDAWVYAYHTGDYQTIADHWDLLTSLNVTPLTMAWASQGRGSIAEMGDEAPPMLALARLAYAVGDRQTYAAAVSWYARELVHVVIKDGAFTRYHNDFRPWSPGWDNPTETATNLWATNAGWQGGGFRSHLPGDNQWPNFYVRLDDPDTLRFHRTYAAGLPRREAGLATPAEKRGNATLYFARVVLLGDNPVSAHADLVRDGGKGQDTFATLRAIAERRYPAHLETLIPPTAPAIPGGDWAQTQTGGNGYGLVNPAEMLPGQWPTPKWYAWDSPAPIPGQDWGDKWTFGSFAPAHPVGKITATDLNPVATLFTYGRP